MTIPDSYEAKIMVGSRIMPIEAIIYNILSQKESKT